MRCLTTTEGVALLSAKGLNLTLAAKITFPATAHNLAVQIPSEARTQRLLARDLAQWLGASDPAFFWLANWPHAKADEATIISALRQAHGETRAWSETPCHLFEPAREGELAAWLGLAMSFGLEGFFGTIQRPQDSLRLAREELIQVSGGDPGRLNAIREFAERYELDIYEESPMENPGTGHAITPGSP